MSRPPKLPIQNSQKSTCSSLCGRQYQPIDIVYCLSQSEILSIVYQSEEQVDLQYSVLQYVTLQCVAVCCCSSVAVHLTPSHTSNTAQGLACVLQYVAVQCVAVKCVAVCCSAPNSHTHIRHRTKIGWAWHAHQR